VRLETATSLGIPIPEPYAGPPSPSRLIDGDFIGCCVFGPTPTGPVLRRLRTPGSLPPRIRVQSMISILKIFLLSSLIAVKYIVTVTYLTLTAILSSMLNAGKIS